MNWIWLALSSYLIWAFVNLVDKVMVSKYVKNPLTLLLINASFTTVLIIGYVLFFQHVALLPWFILFIVLIAGAARFITYYVYFRAIEQEEASRVTILMQLSPIFTLILAYFLVGERLNHWQIIAFALLLIGGLIASIHHENKKFKISSAFWLLIIFSFGIALSTVLIKLGLEFGNFWEIMFWVMLGELITVTLSSLFMKKNLVTTFIKLPSLVKIIFLSGVITSGIAFILNSKALETGPASMISALSVTNPIFVFILATLATIFIPKIIKENITFKNVLIKILALVFISFGLVLLSK